MIEREVKLGAWPGFEVPDLTGAVPGVVSRPHRQARLDAVYHDTPDLRLIRAGITLRWRTKGDAGGDGEWTVKFPAAAEGIDGGLARDEITVAGPPGAVPAAVAGLVRAYARTAGLVPVAHLQTMRRSFVLATEEADHDAGAELAEVDDDEVSVLDGDRVAARFREIEVELARDAPDELLDAVVARLRQAGAGAPDPTPKLVRALGPRALAPADVVPAELPADPTAAEVLTAGVTAAVVRVLEHDRVIRLDDDPEGVHQARVGLRRLRSDLRTYRPLLDQTWAEPLRDEMGWLARELGAVRDADVLLGRLRRNAALLPKGDAVEADRVLARLEKERAVAQAGLVRVLCSARYAALLDRLVDAALSPRLLPEATAGARGVLPALAAKPWRKLRKDVRALEREASDEVLHGIRIRVKRARYAADVAAPVVGDEARAFAKKLGKLQDTLGDIHDAAVAESWLREAAGNATRAQALAIGELIAAERRAADLDRRTWTSQWQKVDRRKVTRWLS